MQNDEILLNESEIVETKPNKLKIVLSIIASTLVIVTITTLLIGHLKFDWFKSDEYKIDAQIKRRLYQANYFSEVKTINIKFNLKDDHIEEKKYIVDNNFVVFLTDKKDNLNTGALVLLSATATVSSQIKELPHLDMFDEKERKEIEANPNGAKYPMAVFTFTDDGLIQKINLPNNMDEYNAESIIELINKVIPKLTRNKKEDLSKGLEITTKKTKNKRTIVQSEAPKEIKEFKGSRYAKVVKTEIEDNQITKVESDGDLYMASKPEGEEITFGPKEFFYNDKSEIALNEVRYNEKENVDLFNQLAEKFTLIDSEVLLKSFKKSKEEKNKNKEIEVKEETKQTRNLFFFNAYKVFNLITFDILKQKVSVKYEVGINNFKAVNKIVISSGLGDFDFGLSRGSDDERDSKRYGQPIFVFPLPPLPIISISCYVSGSLSYGVSLYSGTGLDAKYKYELNGTLALGGEIKAGWDPIASASVFAEGNVVEASGSLILSHGSRYQGYGFRLSAGKVVIGVRFKEFGIFEQSWSHTLFEGWTLVDINK